MSDLLRMTGMYSGMDTESIIASLVSAKQTKVTKLKGEQTKLEWKQTAWQDLNKKIYGLYSSTLSKLRLTGAYKKKNTTSSDPTKATVTADDSAVNGTQTLKINRTAKSGYLTGAEIEHKKIKQVEAKDEEGNIKRDENGKIIYENVEYDAPLKTTDAISEISKSILGTTLTVTVGKGEDAKVTKIEIKDEKDEDTGKDIPMTINKFLAKLRDAGVNATFDEANQRFFISSKDTGLEHEFSITDDTAGNKTLKALGIDDNKYMIGKAISYDGSTKTVNDTTPLGITADTEINVRVGTKINTLNVGGTNKDFIADGQDYKIKLESTDTIKSVIDKFKAIGVDCTFNEDNQRFEFSSKQKVVLEYANVNPATGQVTGDGNALKTAGLGSLTIEDGVQVGTVFTGTKRLNGGEKISLIEKKGNAAATPNYQLVGKTIEVTIGEGDEAVKRNIKITEDMTLTSLGWALQGFKVTDDMTSEEILEATKASKNTTGVFGGFNSNTQRFEISSSQKVSFKVKDENGVALSDADQENALGVLGLPSEMNKTETDCTRIAASDSEIELNGAKFVSSKSAFTINGLTINALNTTGDETLTITTTTDYDGIYNTIKDFLSEYNELIIEMDKLYNADSARKYDMLTDEQKEAMTDDEIEKWEGTIKNSLLRKDNSLNSVMSSLVNTMMDGFYTTSLTPEQEESILEKYMEGMSEADKRNISESQKKAIIDSWYAQNGNKKYLSDFGIKTLSYFNAKDNEHHAYHIDGDTDDESTGTNTDKLRAAITEDPEGTAEFFAALCKKLYDTLDKQMARTDYSSMYKVYNDKQMTKEYDSYTKKIKEAEKALSEYEDKWYNKFSAMEVALSKLQSNTNAVTSMLG